MSRSSGRYFELAVIGLIVVLTLSTAYIHYWVGGMMLMLNAGGYLGLTVLIIGATLFLRRAVPIVLMALAAYSALTIVGWLIMGPYFDVAYIAKGIEVLLIATIATFLWLRRDEARMSLRWGTKTLDRALRVVTRRPAPVIAAATAGTAEE